MKIKMMIVLSILVAAVSCMMPTVVYQLDSTVSFKDSWKTYLTQNPAPKIVLRVPGYSKEITQAEMAQYESLYNDIERRLLQNQFTVRDRSLLREVLTRAGGELNYAEIGRKVDTDLILEIVSFRMGTMAGEMFYEGASTPPAPVDVYGAILEGRIIMVSSGEIVGMFTLKELHPRPEYWVRAKGARTFSVDLAESDSEAMKSAITQNLINVLKGFNVLPSRITRMSGYGPKGGTFHKLQF